MKELSRRGLVVRLLLFSVPLATGFGLIEARLRTIPNALTKKRAALEDRASQVEIAVLGMSNAVQGIRPSLFRRPGYSLANVSQSLYYDAQLISSYRPKMPALRLVIWSIHYAALRTSLSDSLEYWRQYFYERYEGFPPEGPLDEWDLRHFSLFFLYTPLKSVEYAAHGFHVDLAKDIDDFGWERTVGTSAYLNPERGRERVENHELGMTDEHFKRNVVILEDTVRSLRQGGVAVALVVLPVAPTYSDFVRPSVRSEMVATLERLSKEYGATYFDDFEDPRFNSTDFGDNDHLNEVGAEKVSRLLDDTVVGPILGVPPR